MKKTMMLVLALGWVVVGGLWAGEDTKTAERSLTGEVVCLSCYLGHDATGEAHAKCAKQCFKNGLPIGLESGGKLYLVVGGHHTTANELLAAHAGRQVTVTGRVVEKDGMSMVEIKSAKVVGAEKEVKSEKSRKVDKIYTCPMHPEIHRDEMGKCPECGMDLKPVKK